LSPERQGKDRGGKKTKSIISEHIKKALYNRNENIERAADVTQLRQ